MDEHIRQTLVKEFLSQLNGMSNLERVRIERQKDVENVTKL